MAHAFEKYVVCRDEYLPNPDTVVTLSNKQQYKRTAYYPGVRTENLLLSTDLETREFGSYFAERLKFDVFPGISSYDISVHFHINDQPNGHDANIGWVHNDNALLAGLVYLNIGETNFLNGTSMFNNTDIDIVLSEEDRAHFNLTGIATEQYIVDCKLNQQKFAETIKIGNQFNRLIAYDAKIFHRPNSYITTSSDPRKSLLFFIYKYDYIDFLVNQQKSL
jgi:hypothetical protein